MPRKPSSTKTTERTENDFYPTPDQLALAISQRLHQLWPNPTVIIEPSAGHGAFVRHFKTLWDRPVVAIEIQESARVPLLNAKADMVEIDSFENWIRKYAFPGPSLLSTPRGVLMAGNPPFSLAQEHIILALDYLMPGSWIAFLLKVNFFGSYDRVNGVWKRGELKHFIPIVPRPSFKTTEKSSNDSNEYGVFIWEVGYQGYASILPHIVWKAQSKT